MRNYLSYTALGVALAAGTSLAHAQTVDTVIPQPVPLVVAQQPVVAVPAPVAAAPVETLRRFARCAPRRFPPAGSSGMSTVG